MKPGKVIMSYYLAREINNLRIFFPALSKGEYRVLGI